MPTRSDPTPAAPTPASSRLAEVSAQIGAVCAWPGLLGILGVQAGWLAPLTAFGAFAFSLLLALVALGMGILALLQARGRPDTDAGPARRAVVAGGAIVAIVGLAVSPRLGSPRINDVSTDLLDPPIFKVAQTDSDNADHFMRFPPEFAPIIREAYPDIQPLLLKVPRYMAYYRVRRAAERLGWEIVSDTPKTGTLEARARSRFFRFVDDIVVRIRTRGEMSEYSLVDVRSRSRIGRGDLGANANRIRRFLEFL